jgi:hypothetical protein
MGRVRELPPAQVPVPGDRLGLDSHFIMQWLCSSCLPPVLDQAVLACSVLHHRSKD